MNNKQLYEIRLEDYSLPRHMSVVKAYYGTRDDIDILIAHLKDDNHLRIRYGETIEAAESYDGTNMPVHNVAGHVVPILTPVKEISRFETRLADQSWNYTTHTSAVFPCRASAVELCQALIRTENGYERCLKAKVFGLAICHHGTGWTCPNNAIKGFPGIVTWNDKQHTMNLFVSQAHYDFEELT